MEKTRFDWLESQLGQFNFLLRSKDYVEAMDIALNQVKRQFGTRTNTLIPMSEDVFAAYKNCNLNRLKVVIVANRPYPMLTHIDKPVASGYAYGIREKISPIPLPLQSIISAVDLHYAKDADYTFRRISSDPSKLWGETLAKSGVLLMNYQLVTDTYNPQWSSDQRVFSRVSNITADMIRQKFPTVLWCMPKNIELWDYIPEPRKLEFNPMDDNFVLSNTFDKINNYLITHGESPVQW